MAMDPLSCMLSFGLLCAPDPAPKPATGPEQPEASGVQTELPGEAGPAGADKAIKASEILGKVESFYRQAKDLQVEFRQTYIQKIYGTNATSTGVLKVKKPGMMQFDYSKSSDPDVYADGKTLWVVERDTRQVIRRSVEESEFVGAQKFLFGGAHLLEEFLVRYAGDDQVKAWGMPGHEVIELKPKVSNQHYKRLFLVVDPATGRVDSFVIRQGDDSTSQFVLTNLKLDTGIPASAFQFKPPPGYVIIKE